MSGAVTLQVSIDTKDCTARLNRLKHLVPLASEGHLQALAAWNAEPASPIIVEWDGTTGRAAFVPAFAALLDEIEAACAAKAGVADLGGGV